MIVKSFPTDHRKWKRPRHCYSVLVLLVTLPLDGVTVRFFCPFYEKPISPDPQNRITLYLCILCVISSRDSTAIVFSGMVVFRAMTPSYQNRKVIQKQKHHCNICFHGDFAGNRLGERERFRVLLVKPNRHLYSSKRFDAMAEIDRRVIGCDTLGNPAESCCDFFFHANVIDQISKNFIDKAFNFLTDCRRRPLCFHLVFQFADKIQKSLVLKTINVLNRALRLRQHSCRNRIMNMLVCEIDQKTQGCLISIFSSGCTYFHHGKERFEQLPMLEINDMVSSFKIFVPDNGHGIFLWYNDCQDGRLITSHW